MGGIPYTSRSVFAAGGYTPNGALSRHFQSVVAPKPTKRIKGTKEETS